MRLGLRLLILSGAALVCATVVACGGNKAQPGGGGSAGPNNCIVSSDCPAGNTCQNGMCVAPTTCTPSTLCKCDGTDTNLSCSVLNLDPQGIDAADTQRLREELLQNNPNQGIRLGDDGLQLDQYGVVLPYMWIVSTGDGTVSKFSTQERNPDGTFKEVARYATGPLYTDFNCTQASCVPALYRYSKGNDPSRTTINTIGDAYIGNRTSRRVTKIAGDISRCRDRDPEGQPGHNAIETSSDKNNNGKIDNDEILPWGQDECMLWATNVNGTGGIPAVGQSIVGDVSAKELVRAMAAQDDYKDGSLAETHVWVGGWSANGATDWITSQANGSLLWKLNGETGMVEVQTASPVRTYGFALGKDSQGRYQLWIASEYSTRLGRVDVSRCVDNASCNEPTCLGDTADCQKAVKQAIQTPAPSGTTLNYGITVDREQRVWLGGQNVVQYDPKLPIGSRFKMANVTDSRGIAADALGFVYVGGLGQGLLAIARNKFKNDDCISTIAAPNPSCGIKQIAGTTGGTLYGLAVDSEGKVWGIHKGDAMPVPDIAGKTPAETTALLTAFQQTRKDEFATVVKPVVPDPIPAQVDFTNVNFTIVGKDGSAPRHSAEGLDFPYTYSDMSGEQLRLATSRFGFFSHVFRACNNKIGGMPAWQQFSWTTVGSIPTGTHVLWYVRAGNDADCAEKIGDTCKTLAGDYVFAGSTDGTPPPVIMSPYSFENIFINSDASKPDAKANRNKIYMEVKAVLEVTDSSINPKTPRISAFEASSTCSTTPI